MKKYRATEKHPEIKEGMVFSQKYKDDDEYLSNSETIIIVFDDIDGLLMDGWIEEIKELEFTETDMILFGQQCAAEWQKHKLLYIDNELAKYVDSN